MRDLGQRHDDAAADRVAGVQAGQRAQLEHRRAGVDERLEPLAHHHLAAGPVALDVLRAAAGEHLVVQRAHLVGQRAAWRRRCRANSSLAVARCERMGVLTASCPRRAGASARNASIPSAASAPANSSADVAAAAASPSAHPWAGSVRSSALVARTAPGRRLGRWRASAPATQASSAASSSVTAESSPAPAASARRERLAGQRHARRGSAARRRAAPAPRSWPAPRRPGPR